MSDELGEPWIDTLVSSWLQTTGSESHADFAGRLEGARWLPPFAAYMEKELGKGTASIPEFTGDTLAREEARWAGVMAAYQSQAPELDSLLTAHWEINNAKLLASLGYEPNNPEHYAALIDYWRGFWAQQPEGFRSVANRAMDNLLARHGK